MKRTVKGWTLVELLVVMSLVAATTLWAVPAFLDFQQAQALTRASERYLWVWEQAKHAASAQRQTLHMRLQTRCYVVYSGSANACQCQAERVSCSADGVMLSHEHVPPTMQLNSNGGGRVQIEPWRQLVTPSLTMSLQLGHYEVRHLTNILGRTRRCYVNHAILGLPEC